MFLLYRIILHKYIIFVQQVINSLLYSNILPQNDGAHQLPANMNIFHNKNMNEASKIKFRSRAIAVSLSNL